MWWITDIEILIIISKESDHDEKLKFVSYEKFNCAIISNKIVHEKNPNCLAVCIGHIQPKTLCQ